jgi:ABC-type multidrug transport system fused ATPase/permease subunit
MNSQELPSAGPAEARSRTGLWSQLTELYAAASAKRRRQFYLLLGLMLVGTLAELATIGAVVPFIASMASLEAESAAGPLGRLFARIGGLIGGDSVVAATALFVTMVLIAGAIRLQLAWTMRNFTSGIGHDLAVDIQRRALSQPYSFHVGQNSSRFLAALDLVQSLVFDVLLQVMQGGIALFMSLFIVAALIAIDPIIALASASAFAIIYVSISAMAAPQLARNDEALRATHDRRVKIVQESLGGIRDVIIDGSRDVIVDEFDRVNRRYGLTRVTTGFIASAPRFVIEAAGTALIAVVAFAIARRDGSIAAALPTLGALAIGAQRLLPLVQQIYAAWSNIAGRRTVVSQVLDLLALPLDERETARQALPPLPLHERILFDCVRFSYPGRRGLAIDDVTLEIPKGSKVGIVGRTGSGKSTLVDLLMGLLEPTGGQITVDGVPLEGDVRRRWHRSIAHVPQAIFLADASIAENIAFSLPGEAIDMERVIEAARKAQLHQFVDELPDGYATCVGERGVRLSGGQRQRLGIARAIYKQAPVLVLDEGTSALDETTEAALIDSLLSSGGNDRTVIIIAHRLSTVAGCETIVRLDAGRIVATGSPDEVFGREERPRVSR